MKNVQEARVAPQKNDAQGKDETVIAKAKEKQEPKDNHNKVDRPPGLAQEESKPSSCRKAHENIVIPNCDDGDEATPPPPTRRKVRSNPGPDGGHHGTCPMKTSPATIATMVE